MYNTKKCTQKKKAVVSFFTTAQPYLFFPFPFFSTVCYYILRVVDTLTISK